MARLGNITFACKDPDRLADFWAAALGYVKEDTPEEIVAALEAEGRKADIAAAARDPKGVGPRLYFERKPTLNDLSERLELEVGCNHDAKLPSVPIHLDLFSQDRAAEVARLIGLGATLVTERNETIGPYSVDFTVLKDPEGNGFCVH